MKENESEVLQGECSIECCLLGEQEQSHSAGTDIICTNISLIVIVILTEVIRMFINTRSEKIEAYRKITIFFVVENSKPLIWWFRV